MERWRADNLREEEKCFVLYFFFPRDKTVSDERFTFGDKRGVSALTPQGIECGLMIQLF